MQFDLFPVGLLAQSVCLHCQDLAQALDRAAPTLSDRDAADLIGELALVEGRLARAGHAPVRVHALPCLVRRWGRPAMSGRPPGTRIRVCSHCGHRFEQGRPDQEYCRDLCRYRAANARRQALVERGKLMPAEPQVEPGRSA